MEVMTKASKSKHKFVLSGVTLRYHCTTWNEGDLKSFRCISPCKKYKLILHRGTTVLQQKCCYTSWFTWPGFLQLRANKIQGVFHGNRHENSSTRNLTILYGSKNFRTKKSEASIFLHLTMATFIHYNKNKVKKLVGWIFHVYKVMFHLRFLHRKSVLTTHYNMWTYHQTNIHVNF